MFDISFVQFDSTIASVPAPTTWRAMCSEECCCASQRQKKTRDNQLGDVINEPTPILDGSAPSCRTTVGRVEHRTANISCVKNTIIIVTVPDEPDDATTSPSFDLDVFPG